MTKITLLAAAVILSAATAAPVLAQPAIQEPGAYAFYHPYADLYGSAPTDATASVPLGNSMAQLRGTTMSHPLHVRGAHALKPH